MFYFNYIVFYIFLTSNVHPQEDLYMQFYGISFIHPYEQSSRWKDVLDRYQVSMNRRRP